MRENKEWWINIWREDAGEKFAAMSSNQFADWKTANKGGAEKAEKMRNDAKAKKNPDPSVKINQRALPSSGGAITPYKKPEGGPAKPAEPASSVKPVEPTKRVEPVKPVAKPEPQKLQPGKPVSRPEQKKKPEIKKKPKPAPTPKPDKPPGNFWKRGLGTVKNDGAQMGDEKGNIDGGSKFNDRSSRGS